MTTNRAVYGAPKSTWTLTSKDGIQSTWPTASEHFLFVSNGYVGPRSKASPPPIHAYEYYHDRLRATRRYQRLYPLGKQDNGSGDCLSTNPSSVAFNPPLNWNNLYSRALDDLNEKVRGGMDVSVDLAQGRQVARMLNVTERVRDYTGTFFKKRFGAIRSLAAMRLEYMYGVKPLMQTTFDAADELIRHQLKKTERFRARATDTSYRPISVMAQMYFGAQTFTNVYEMNMKMSTTLGIEMNVSDNKWDLRRWSSLNPVSIAYELMPYSFVLDWFYNVGGYIRNLETVLAYGFDFRTGYQSNLAAFSGSAIDVFNFTNPPGSDAITLKFNGLRFDRKILNFYPSPQPPRLQVDLGSSRLLNGAALLGNFLGGRDGARRADQLLVPNSFRERVNDSRNVKFRK